MGPTTLRSPPSLDRAEQTESVAAVFGSLWAAAALFHLLNNAGQGLGTVAGWLTAAAAYWLLLRPTSEKRLLLFAVLQITETVWVSPFAADHQILMALANLSLVMRFAVRRERGHLVVRTRATMQWLCLMAYAAAALAKYNTEFLDPATSCAAFLADVASFGLLPPSMAAFPVGLTLLFESAIPILLLLRVTRRLGVIVGSAFHLAVSASFTVVVEDFTFTLIALFILFLPAADVTAIRTAAIRALDRSRIVRDQRRIPESARAALYCALSAGIALRMPIAYILVGTIVSLVVGCALLWVLAKRLRTTPARSPALVRPHAAAIVPLLLMLVVVTSPYAGFRTTGVFTMFSNLRTEGPGTNHLFLPSFHVVDLQNDLVRPGAGSSEHFDQIIADGQALPFHEIRREAALDPSLVLVGERAGMPFDSRVDRIDSPNWMSRRFLQFRAVPDTGAPLCTN